MAKLSVALKKELQKGMPKVDVGRIKPDRMFVRKCWRKGRPGADGPDPDPAPGEVRGWLREPGSGEGGPRATQLLTTCPGSPGAPFDPRSAA